MLPTDPSFIESLQANVLAQVALEPGSAGFGAAFERKLHTALMAVGCRVVERQLAALEPADSRVEDAGRVWVRVVSSPRKYTCRFGEVTVDRDLYRSVRNGPTRCFVEERFGVFDGRWTSEAARLCALLLTDLTSRAAARFLDEQGGMSPTRTKLDRLPTRLGKTAEAHREHLDGELRATVDIPEQASTVAVALDGVMVKLQASNRQERVDAAKQQGRKVGGPIGSSEASVGTLTFYDTRGTRLGTRRFARMPEPDKKTLKDTLRAELNAVRTARPDLAVVAISDGAPNNWSFLEDLDPDFQIVDAYHTLEHIKRRLDRTLGVGTHYNQAVYAKLKDALLDVAGGHRIAFEIVEAIEKRKGKFKPRKRRGRGAQPTFYERHSQRMKYLEHRCWGLPIGSGDVEGTARYMVVDRLRRTGMRWKNAGGQAILTLRQYAANDQFNHAWTMIMHFEATHERARCARAA